MTDKPEVTQAWSHGEGRTFTNGLDIQLFVHDAEDRTEALFSTQCGPGEKLNDPAVLLQRAIDALRAELAELKGCPIHRTSQSEREGTEQHLCGHCGAQYLLMGAGYIDRLREALDRAGAPTWSDDRQIMFSLVERIEALAALATPSPVSIGELVELLKPVAAIGDRTTGLRISPDDPWVSRVRTALTRYRGEGK